MGGCFIWFIQCMLVRVRIFFCRLLWFLSSRRWFFCKLVTSCANLCVQRVLCGSVSFVSLFLPCFFLYMTAFVVMPGYIVAACNEPTVNLRTAMKLTIQCSIGRVGSDTHINKLVLASFFMLLMGSATNGYKSHNSSRRSSKHQIDQENNTSRNNRRHGITRNSDTTNQRIRITRNGIRQTMWYVMGHS